MPSQDKDPPPIQVISVAPLNPLDTALIKYGEQVITKSSDTIRDFAKGMITLDSGLFAVYFAILKFLNLGNVSSQVPPAILGLSIIPPLLFVSSVVAFVIAILPLRKQIDPRIKESIENFRRWNMRIKYAAAIAGLILFVVAMVMMASLSIGLISQPLPASK